MTDSRKKDLIENGVLVFSAQMIVNVCNFGFHFLVSRRIGVVAYGTLNALVSAFQVLVVPALIVNTVLVKYAAAFHANSEEGRVRSLLSRSMLVLGLAAAAVFVLGAAFSGSVASFLNATGRLPILLMLGILCFNLVLPVRGILQGMEYFKPYSVSLTLEAAVKVLAAGVFTVVGWGIDGALGGWLLGCAVALFFTWGAQWFPRRGLVTPPLGLNVREALTTTSGVTLAMVCVTSLGFTDVVLVKHYFDPVSAGLYGAAALSGKMLYFLVYFVPAVLLPRVAADEARGKDSGKMLLAAMAVVLAFGGAGNVLYRFFPSLVVQALAGHAFAAGAPLVFPYGIAATLLAALNVAVTYKIGLGRYEFILPLVGIALAQIAAIIAFHTSALQIIAVLIGCNAVALILVLLPFRYSLKAPLPAHATQGST